MNWIKMTTNLDTKPEVMMLADLLGVNELHVVGLLWKLWTWLDQNITNCYAVSVTRALLDRITCAGMSDALQKVGWLSGDDGALVFQNFDRHNGKTAKERACSAKRMNDKRNRDSVTPALRSERNAAVTREEKRREEKNSKSRALPRPSLSEISEFCKTLGLPELDAQATFHKWEGNGYTNNGKPIKDWKATIRAWKAAGYMPSQKQNQNGTPPPKTVPAFNEFVREKRQLQ